MSHLGSLDEEKIKKLIHQEYHHYFRANRGLPKNLEQREINIYENKVFKSNNDLAAKIEAS